MPIKLDLTARQVTAICKGAARAGYVAIVQIGDISIRLVPENAASVGTKPVNRIDELLAGSGRSTPQNRPGVPIQSKVAELARSDRQHRGKNETEEETAARRKKVVAKWETDLLRSDLEHRERRVVDQLLSRPAEPQHISTIAMAGRVTLKRLEFRGFVELTESKKKQIETVMLTSKGRRALGEIEKQRRTGGYL